METRTPNAAALIDAMGLLIEAPGFTPETFAAGVAKAQATGYMHMWPARKGSGAILVETANTNGAAYHVTRAACDCYGSRTHGHCYHRAAAIYASDFYGIDLCRDELLGFDANGEPITADQRLAQLSEVA